MSRPILGFSNLGAFSPDSRPRILTNLALAPALVVVLLVAISSELVPTTKDLSDYNISNAYSDDGTGKRTAEDADLLELDDFPSGF